MSGLLVDYASVARRDAAVCLCGSPNCLAGPQLSSRILLATLLAAVLAAWCCALMLVPLSASPLVLAAQLVHQRYSDPADGCSLKAHLQEDLMHQKAELQEVSDKTIAAEDRLQRAHFLVQSLSSVQMNA